MSEPITLDLDARRNLSVQIKGKTYKVYAPPMSKTPLLAEVLQRVEHGAEGLDNGSIEQVKGFIESIADFVEVFTQEIPREDILGIDLATAVTFVTALRGLLPKEAPSPAPKAN